MGKTQVFKPLLVTCMFSQKIMKYKLSVFPISGLCPCIQYNSCSHLFCYFGINILTNQFLVLYQVKIPTISRDSIGLHIKREQKDALLSKILFSLLRHWKSTSWLIMQCTVLNTIYIGLGPQQGFDIIGRYCDLLVSMSKWSILPIFV